MKIIINTFSNLFFLHPQPTYCPCISPVSLTSVFFFLLEKLPLRVLFFCWKNLPNFCPFLALFLGIQLQLVIVPRFSFFVLTNVIFPHSHLHSHTLYRASNLFVSAKTSNLPYFLPTRLLVFSLIEFTFSLEADKQIIIKQHNCVLIYSFILSIILILIM